ncbi:MAG: hypothetical protein MI723_15210, partial [Caulobacterales bacterium]|nr:hypothetical protein [Caulobacterales bacterium]
FLDVPAAITGWDDAPEAWRSLAQARLSGADPCPVLLWSVHNIDRGRLEGVRHSLAAREGAPALTIEAFTYADPGLLWPRRSAAAQAAADREGAHILRVAPRGAPDAP